MWSRLNRTGTATRRRCMPMSVPPMSMPAAARTSSTRTGSRKARQQLVAQLPPAWGWGMAATIWQPIRPGGFPFQHDGPVQVFAALGGQVNTQRSTVKRPCSCSGGSTPRQYGGGCLHAGIMADLPRPMISLLEQPTTKRSPVSRCAFCSSSSVARRALLPSVPNIPSSNTPLRPRAGPIPYGAAGPGLSVPRRGPPYKDNSRVRGTRAPPPPADRRR